ncbi:MAG: hypothetical protein HQ553_09025 [Chloroflexi bacterium]|nr:hypothetical protein [Chloroflexota bacterium]
MFDKTQILILLAGISLMTAAGVLGFGQNNWIVAVVLGGVGSSTFIVGTQRDR